MGFTAVVRRGGGAVTVAAGGALVMVLAVPAWAAPGVDPAVVERAADPGATISVGKVVSTPPIPPKPDVVLVVDTTGSMGPAIADVRANLQQVIDNVRGAQPAAEFAVASYRDEGDGPELFRVRQDLTGDAAAVQDAVDGLDADGGGDTPEAWINALFQVSDGGITYRADSSRIVVLVGDAPSHDPSSGHTLAEATAALRADTARVLAVDVSGGGGGLDADGQATIVADATGGQVVGSSPDTVTEAILSGLRDLDVTVTPTVAACDPGLSVSFDAPSKTRQSGTDVPFDETVAVADDAAEGTTLHCTVEFLLNGVSGGSAFVERISVAVNDVTAPAVGCVPTSNPSGGNTPGSDNPDGFYELTATDVVDSAVEVFIGDTGDPSVGFGPFPAGTRIKLVQAPGARPRISDGAGDIDYRVTVRGDAVITGVDDSGNASTVTCLVAPPPK